MEWENLPSDGFTDDPCQDPGLDNSKISTNSEDQMATIVRAGIVQVARQEEGNNVAVTLPFPTSVTIEWTTLATHGNLPHVSSEYYKRECKKVGGKWVAESLKVVPQTGGHGHNCPVVMTDKIFVMFQGDMQMLAIQNGNMGASAHFGCMCCETIKAGRKDGNHKHDWVKNKR